MKAALALTMALPLALSVPASADNGNHFGNDNGNNGNHFGQVRGAPGPLRGWPSGNFSGRWPLLACAPEKKDAPIGAAHRKNEPHRLSSHGRTSQVRQLPLAFISLLVPRFGGAFPRATEIASGHASRVAVLSARLGQHRVRH
jgi:hypothetical protein